MSAWTLLLRFHGIGKVFGLSVFGFPAVAVLLISACGDSSSGTSVGLEGAIEIDGSSTVYPVSVAAAEIFRETHPRVQIPVGISGTGGGFQRFVKGETEISNASRLIRDSEREEALANGIGFLELQVAVDGLSVVVSKDNDFVSCLTVDELKLIWEPGSTFKLWSDVRPEFPDQEIRLFGPDSDSGTFDYFTEVIVGEEDASRPDFTASADDNVLVVGVQSSKYALGYFGYAYYLENEDNLKVLGVDNGDGCITPEEDTINDGSYAPLSRPLFIYVSKPALQREEVKTFVDFYLENGAELASQGGYVGLNDSDYQRSLDAVLEASLG